MPEQDVPRVDQGADGPVADGDIPDGVSCTAEESFYLDWAQESYKQVGPFLNDCLQKLITLDVALIGGGLLLGPRDDILPVAARVPPLVLLVLSLACAVIGVRPFGRARLGFDPAAEKVGRAAAVRRKSGWLSAASWLLVAALATAVALIGRHALR